jgi:flagellar biosynthesis protein FlhA
MPWPAFMIVGGGLIVLGWRMKRKTDAADRAAAAAESVPRPAGDSPEDLLDQMRVHALEVLLSPDLIDLVSGGGNDLLGRVKSLRRKIALDLGFIVPPVRTRDAVDLPPGTYAIRIAGVEAGRGQAPSGRLLALGEQLELLPGTATVEPVFGLPGKWIPAEQRHTAELNGATVVDRVSVVVTHLSAVITGNAARLLSREDVRVLTDAVRTASPSAVDELIPAPLSLAEVQRVLQGLLAEQVAINDLTRIYEALALKARTTTDPEALIEAAREGLGAAVAARYVEDGVLRVLMIEPGAEQSLLEALRPSPLGSQIVLDPASHERLMGALKREAEQAAAKGFSPALVCAPQLRPAVRRFVAGQGVELPVLSYSEATAGEGTTIETVGVVRLAQPAPLP